MGKSFDKALMGAAGTDGSYEIDQSISLNSVSVPNIYRQLEATGNRRTFTLSYWLKPSLISTDSSVSIDSGNSGGTSYAFFGFRTYHIRFQLINGNSSVGLLQTNAVFRDSGAWYHIVGVVDTTQGTAANRMKIYVNGTQITSFSTATYPSQNLDTAFSVDDNFINVGANTYWNTDNSYNGGIDGNMAEVHVIDGAAKAPSDFGEINEKTGQWIPKEYTGGSYGTNGFYGKFVSGAIGTDSSGQGNNMTVANLANADVLIDTPTNNFATLNPTDAFANGTFSEGNLKVITPSNAHGLSMATIVPSSGKFYAEFTPNNTGAPVFGVRDLNQTGMLKSLPEGVGTTYGYYSPPSGTGYMYTNNGSGGNSGIATKPNFTAGDVVAVTIDYDNGEVKLYNQNGLQYTASSLDLTDVTFGVSDMDESSSTTTWVANFGQNGTFSGLLTAGGNTDANDIGNFFYAPPSGFLALCTKNLADPVTPLPSKQFNSVVYAGAGQTQTVTGVGFQPDFVWIKNRSATSYHNLMDAVRGIGSTTKALFSHVTDAEASLGSGTNKVSAVNSNGFVIDGNSNDLNNSNENYVSWNWKANGSGSTVTTGDLDAVVSANQAAGFSIVTWTANGSNTATVPHGLGVAPEIIFYKARSTAGNWNTWTTAIDTSNDSLLLNTTAAKSNNSGDYGNLTSSFFPNWGLGNGITMVAYSFVSKPGYSKIGVYTGNGNVNGPFVNCGFKPALILVKRTDSTNDWVFYDNKRSSFNAINESIYANTNAAESNYSGGDFLSNGFKIRYTGGMLNTNNGTYLYMAFAESPFKTATAH